MAQASPAQPLEPQRTSPGGKTNPFQKAFGMIVGFFPWIVYWSLAGNVPFRVAVGLACAVSVLLSARTLWQRRAPKVIEIGSAIVFLLLLIATFVTSTLFLQRWLQPLTNGGLFLISLTSVLIGKSFTLQYARESTPPEIAAMPLFQRVNRTITLVWVCAFALMTLSSLIPPIVYGQAVISHRGTPLSIVCYWVLPFGFLGIAAFFSFWYPEWIRSHKGRERADASPTPHP